jgi:hypothetical protein
MVDHSCMQSVPNAGPIPNKSESLSTIRWHEAVWTAHTRVCKVTAMRPSSRLLLAVLFCTACDRTAQHSDRALAAASSSPSKVLPNPDSADTTDIMFRDPPDSNTFSWSFAPAHDYLDDSRFTGRHVRHPSGLLVLWFDTATRATEDTPAGTVHVDSIVVSGIKHGEFLTYYCNTRGRRETQIVGIVRDSSTYTRPRVAWLLDTASNRIRAFRTDSVLCTPGDIFSGDVDD